MDSKPRKHTRTGSDFRTVVNRPAPPPTGRAADDYVHAADVSYQPNERERRFIDRLVELPLSDVSRAEAECVIRQSLAGFRMTPLHDRKTLQTEAKKFGIDLKTT